MEACAADAESFASSSGPRALRKGQVGSDVGEVIVERLFPQQTKQTQQYAAI